MPVFVILFALCLVLKIGIKSIFYKVTCLYVVQQKISRVALHHHKLDMIRKETHFYVANFTMNHRSSFVRS